MNKEEFVKECKLRGVCRAEIAKIFVSSFTDDHDFIESDFEDAFRFEDRYMYRRFDRRKSLRTYESALSTKHFKYE